MVSHQTVTSLDRNSIQGVILDVDGTLIDSNDAHAEAWYKILQKHHIDVSYEKIRSLIGMGGDNFLPAAAGIEKDSSQGKQIAKERGELFKSNYLSTLNPFPKVTELLEQMKAQGLRLVAGSSSEPEELEALLKIAGANSYLEEQTSAGDADRSKPDPDIIHVALEKLQLKPNQVILIGDTPYDIEAASKADVRTIAFRCGGWKDSDLKGAVAIYDDPADLLANYQTSPLSVQGVQH